VQDGSGSSSLPLQAAINTNTDNPRKVVLKEKCIKVNF
jgi:hypothetical protein